MENKAKQALETLDNYGMLARDSKELECLTCFRKLPAEAKNRQLMRMGMFLEAWEIGKKEHGFNAVSGKETERK